MIEKFNRLFFLIVQIFNNFAQHAEPKNHSTAAHARAGPAPPAPASLIRRAAYRVHARQYIAENSSIKLRFIDHKSKETKCKMK
ncbi:hypothetical protein [Delftia sp. PS-11]|uniref:hypothetical protein n=1 Tax=Delftia sp. PS-11 TaxID=2767222 RepID=UPI0024556055|nr:hypothetical protein [Delftia sp. PS-11]KAJ8741622.1 hypothetical protein H9T68_21555 [Delftia sp. PS-11]